MPALVRTAGTLELTFDGSAYSCQIISASWSFVGEKIYTGCSPTDGAALAGRDGDGAVWELTLDVLADWSATGLDYVLLSGNAGEEVAYVLELDATSATVGRKYSGNAVIPEVAEEWTAGTTERVTLVIPVRTRTIGRPTV